MLEHAMWHCGRPAQTTAILCDQVEDETDGLRRRLQLNVPRHTTTPTESVTTACVENRAQSFSPDHSQSSIVRALSVKLQLLAKEPTVVEGAHEEVMCTRVMTAIATTEPPPR